MRAFWLSHSGTAGGGAELSMLEAIRGLRARGVEACVVIPEHGNLAEALAGMGATVQVVPFSWWVSHGRWRAAKYKLKRSGRNLLYVPTLLRLLRRWRPDVVVSNTLSIPSGAIAARLARLPHVWYMHEMFGSDGHGLSFDLGQAVSLALIDKLSARVIVNSKTVFDSYRRRIPAHKLRLVYYGVEVPPQPARAEDPARTTLRLIQVGNVASGKRPEDAVRALALLVAKGLDVRLTLLGAEVPEQGAFLRALAQRLNVARHVEFIGFSKDPFCHMAAADVAVMCSRGEAFGRVTVEAMKLGKPVVGADSAGTSELIQEGTTGLLFRVGDARDLALKLETLYHDRALLRTLGGNAQAWAVQTFTQQRYVSSLIEVFQEVCAPPRARRRRRGSYDRGTVHRHH